MMISATELKMNLGKYLNLASSEDIIIQKNGKAIARITAPNTGKSELLKSLIGAIPYMSDEEIEDIKKERILK